MQLCSDSLSDIGKQRSKNEDACFADPQAGLFLVADGMGGHPAGEVASRMAIGAAVSRCHSGLSADCPDAEIPQRIEAICQQLSRQIHQAGQDNPSWHGMGTTLALVCCRENLAYLANVGDSRIYLLRAGILQQCSKDHTLGDDQSPLHHILTQALGADQPLEVHQQQLELQPGDRLLLCSDGLTNMLSDQAICRLLSLPREPQQLCQQLVAAANDRGGLDNISVVVVLVEAS